MSKLTLAIAATFLVGCASFGEWRALSIDGGSEAAFAESLSRLNEELSLTRSQILSLALVDIARTGVQTAGTRDDGRPAYTDEDFRAELDGLTYEGVIALADRSGPRIATLYYSRGWAETGAETNRLLTAGDNPLGPTPPPQPSIDSSGTINWPGQ